MGARGTGSRGDLPTGEYVRLACPTARCHRAWLLIASNQRDALPADDCAPGLSDSWGTAALARADNIVGCGLAAAPLGMRSRL
jgi:hypothetical protein